MDNLQPAAWVGVLAFAAGAVHVIAPDHWMPASILAWKRGWSLRKSTMFALGIYLIHVILGLAIYFCADSILGSILGNLQSSSLFLFGIGLVFFVMMIRMVRFSRIREVIGSGPASAWGPLAVFSLLGPCESIIPILLKSRQLGIGYFIPYFCFQLGTLVAGMSLIVAGRILWDRPLWLPQGIYLANRKVALIPTVAIVAIGLGVLFRI